MQLSIDLQHHPPYPEPLPPNPFQPLRLKPFSLTHKSLNYIVCPTHKFMWCAESFYCHTISNKTCTQSIAVNDDQLGMRCMLYCVHSPQAANQLVMSNCCLLQSNCTSYLHMEIINLWQLLRNDRYLAAGHVLDS